MTTEDRVVRNWLANGHLPQKPGFFSRLFCWHDWDQWAVSCRQCKKCGLCQERYYADFPFEKDGWYSR